MKFDPQKHHRRSIRLKGYDYTRSGAYFVTIVVWQRECLFGEIIDGEMRLNQFGKIVQRAWFDLPKHYPYVQLGTFCIMPNHVHAVIILIEPIVGAGLRPAPTGPAPTGPAPTGPAPTGPAPTERHPLSEIVRAFKSFSARRINELRKTQGIPVWQRNYYEHIIRNDEEHNRIHLYIEANPANWMEDNENPANVK
jgi:REP element-mobilizing transposase RayT